MKPKFVSIALAALAMACASVASAGNVFYWYGTWNKSMTWADYTDYLNWSLAKDSYSNADHLIPGKDDCIWCGGWTASSDNFIGYFDLKGTEQTITAWAPGTGPNGWLNYIVHLTNGTLTVQKPTYNGSGSNCNQGRLFTIWDGATLIYPKATFTADFFASSMDEQWRVKGGGRVEVYCSTTVEGGSEPKGDGGHRGATQMTVAEGGTLILDPVDFGTGSMNRYGVDFINEGEMLFPHGLIWSRGGAIPADKASGYCKTDRVSVRQNAGTMLVGGDFVKTVKNAAIPGQFDFILAGGTLEVTNSVRFYTAESAYNLSKGWTDQVFASMPDDAVATVDVKVGSRIDMSNFTFGSNTYLTKTGPGILVLGANRPTGLDVTEGMIGFVGAVDLTGITLAGDATVSFEALGMSVDGTVAANGRKFTFGSAFAEGDTIVTADSAATAAKIVDNMVIPAAYAGFSVRADGNEVVLVKGDSVVSHTYFWTAKRSVWSDARNLSNWTWDVNGTVRAERQPCSSDLLYGFGSDGKIGCFDLGGFETRFANFGIVPVGSAGVDLISVTNGTLTFTALAETSRSTRRSLDVWDGGRLVLDGTAKTIWGRNSSAETYWKIRNGGRLDLVHGDPAYDRMIAAQNVAADKNEFNMIFLTVTVDEGGTLVFDPAKFCLNNGSHDAPVTISNSGTLLAPHGIVWNGYDPWTDTGCHKRFTVNQNAGTMYLGGNFTKVIPESTDGLYAMMKFVFAGGTLVTSNSVGFLKGVLSQGTYEVEAAMTGSGTVRTEAGSVLDMGVMTYGAGVTLTKEGPGVLRLKNLPPTLDAKAGTVALDSAVTDFSGLTFADGLTVEFGAKGTVFSGVANADKLSYSVGDGFAVGDTVVTAGNEELAQYIAAHMTLPAYLKDYAPVASGTAVQVKGALKAYPRDVTIYVGDEPVDHGFLLRGMPYDAPVWDFVEGTPVYDFGGYAAGSAAGTYTISLSGLTGKTEAVQFETATLTVLEKSVSETFYWMAAPADWADFGDVANWATSADGKTPATRLPGANDLIWGHGRTFDGDFGTLGHMDLCGQTYEFKSLVWTDPPTNWKSYLLTVRNGTLRAVAMSRTAPAMMYGTGFTVQDGATLDLNCSDKYFSGVGGVRYEDWTINAGSRIAFTGGDLSLHCNRILVRAGGECLFAPGRMGPYNAATTRDPIVVENAGAFVAPNGLVWNTTETTSNSGQTKTFRFTQKAGGTLYLGGDFTKTTVETTTGQPASMQFVFEGGTVAASNSVAFCNRVLSFGYREVQSTMTGNGTVDVAEGATLDFDIMTYSDGVKLTKTGPGLFRFGANLPSSFEAVEGGVAFSDLLSDASGMTFADGVRIVLGEPGNAFAPPANYANLGFALDQAKFSEGAVVLTSDDADFLAHVAEEIAGTVPEGTRAVVSDGKIVLEPTGDDVFVSDGAVEITEAGSWNGKVVPAGRDAVICGDRTIALVNNVMPDLKSIKVTGGATLRIAHGTIDLPPITLVSPSTLEIAGAAIAYVTNGLTCLGDRNGIPVLSIETNGELNVEADARIKNVDIRLCGTLGAMPVAGGRVPMTLGYATAGEVSYFALTSVGGTLRYAGANDNTSNDSSSRRFVIAEEGGRVVVTRPILLQDTTFALNSKTPYVGTIIGNNNPLDEPFEFVLDNTRMPLSRGNRYGGALTLKLINGSEMTPKTYHPGVAMYLESTAAAKVLVEGEGAKYLFSNADPYKCRFAPETSGTVVLEVRDGGEFAAHNTQGNGRGVAVFADGICSVPDLPFVPADLNPKPADTNVLNWMSDLFVGFKSVEVPEGKSLTIRSAAILGASGGYMNWKEWDRNVKLANIPITGAGDVVLGNETPGYSMTLTIVASSNTCTGAISVDRGADPTTLLFADGANWAGTVVGGRGVSCTNLVNAAAPAEVSFAALELAGTMPVRVWTKGGSVTSDTINIASALTGNGAFTPVFMDGRPTADVTFTVGRYPASAGVPDAKFAKRGCTFSVEPIAGTDDVWLKMIYVPQGTMLLIR